MQDRAMLDVSMFLHRDALNHLRGLAQGDALENLVVSATLARLADRPEQLWARFAPLLGIHRNDRDSEALAEVPRIIERLPRYPAQPGESSHLTREFAIAGKDMDFAHILLEEFDFLTTQSWLFAKVRASFDKMIDAGAGAMEVSKDKFEKMVRRSLKKPEGKLSPNDKALAAAKWVAVSGPAVISVIEPISGAAAGIVAGTFLLCDP